MSQSLIKQCIAHNKDGELATWVDGLSASERDQLWREMQDTMAMLAVSFKGLGEAMFKGFAPLSEWIDENRDLVDKIHTLASGEPLVGGK